MNALQGREHEEQSRARNVERRTWLTGDAGYVATDIVLTQCGSKGFPRMLGCTRAFWTGESQAWVAFSEGLVTEAGKLEGG